ncbi:hypothetical protein ACFORH_43470 [Amycolatopsis roodepoortensis]|uniref:DsDNA-specific endonuclease/ATPase MutS2 n=1 Tax=Amycolatopsis roodepoortensis TaxID=700274 RepID=A0ABR9LIU0_9PSEU|nr:hypothetical protein [Amycolatopsis roodepoortensis]MBE1580395.1 dsDNA-specific endonuclease/ATPase MutS2 [Amycolatopsis roodepoortensis]
MSHSIDPARERADHLALANTLALRYHELVLRPEPLAGTDHIAAAALATAIADHLERHADTVDAATAAAVRYAATRARTEARGHDEAAWTDQAVRHALGALLNEVTAR